MNRALDEPLRLIAYLLAPAGDIPNHPRWPLLVYPSAVAIGGADPALAFEAMFDRNGWPAAWRNGVYPFQHFHSNAHEALGVYRGEVTVQLGGEPGVIVTARPGDVIVLPAGTGHRKLSSKGALGIVGAYPSGQSPDMHRPPLADARRCAEAVLRVSRPERDPVHGAGGPLFDHWR